MPRAGLSPTTVVAAAADLADQDGFDAVTPAAVTFADVSGDADQSDEAQHPVYQVAATGVIDVVPGVDSASDEHTDHEHGEHGEHEAHQEHTDIRSDEEGEQR